MNDRPTGARAALPEHPHIDQLRRQARELLRAWQRSEPDALARAAPYALPSPPRLAHAQLVLARELGFASWPKLLDEVEHRRALALHDEAFVERVLVLALGRGYAAPRPAQALALLRSRPGLRHAALRLVQGDAQGIDPRRALPPWSAPPLALVAFSSLATLDATQDAALCAAADKLLAAGADANAGLIEPAFTERPLPVLYGAVARARSAALVQRLLAAGADPNDNESLYHAVEQDDRRIVAPLGQRPPDGPVDRFLAACASADEATARALLASEPDLITRLAPEELALLPEQAQRGAMASVQLMLAFGWPVDVPGPWQASALNQAAFRGDAEMVALLLRHGARWYEKNGYGGDALGSCLHAGCHEPVPGGDYGEVLRLLLADGAPPPRVDDHLTEEMVAVIEGLAAAY